MLQYERHSQERAIERFGVFLSLEELKILMDRIHEGDADYIGKGQRDTTIWCIEHEGQKLYPVIDFDDKFILTFLTKTMAYKTAKRNRVIAK